MAGRFVITGYGHAAHRPGGASRRRTGQYRPYYVKAGDREKPADQALALRPPERREPFPERATLAAEAAEVAEP